MQDKATLLYEWRQLRLNLQKEYSQKQLQELIDWLAKLSPATHGFNFDDMTTWPDIWEYISEGYYTKSGNGLACFYTLHHSQPEKDNQLWLVHDLYFGDMYLVAYSEGYILNRSDNKLYSYSNIKNDAE